MGSDKHRRSKSQPAPSPFGGYHQKNKRHLQAPFAHLFEGSETELKVTHWRDDGFPEFAWTALYLTDGPTETRYDVLRRISLVLPKVKLGSEGRHLAGSHSFIGAQHPSTRRKLISSLVKAIDDSSILRPLLLLPSLPASSDWARVLPEPVPETDWKAIVRMLDHCSTFHSDGATDVCWVRSLFERATGAISEFDGSERDEFRSKYPENREDVGGLFRCSVDQNPFMHRTKWTDAFWHDLWQVFPPEPIHPDVEYPCELVDARFRTVVPIYLSYLGEHFWELKDSRRNAKLEVVFGLMFQSGHLASEILSQNLEYSFSGLAALRSIVECTINLCYLLKKDEAELWGRFRDYGYGKARLLEKKLAKQDPQPKCVDFSWLDAMCGDSPAWYLTDINLGDWTGENLRQRSITGDTKAIYDAYYDYTSSLLHCDWLSIRAIGLTFDANPLHRLQQIPRLAPRKFPSVMWDLFRVIDEQIDAIQPHYPGFDLRLSRMIQSRESRPSSPSQGSTSL